MRIDAGQYMRMEQRMKLSPRMIQSMEVLQLSLLALEERIEQEMEANPTLELVEPGDGESAPDDAPPTIGEYGAPSSNGEATEHEAERPLIVADTQTEAGEDFGRAADMSEQIGEEWAQNTQESADYHTPMRRDNGERDAKMDAMANTAARSASLTDQLLDQWRYMEMPPEVRRAGLHLIEYIDDEGYLRTPLAEIQDRSPPGIAMHDLEAALELVHRHIEPPGIGARDIAESLVLQLDAVMRDEGEDAELVNARRIVLEHLDDLQMNRLPRIAKATGLTMDQINAALARLRRLDPRPGRRIAPEPALPIFPDVIVEYDPYEDRYVAALNRGRTPALRINPLYRDLAADRTAHKDTRQYLAKNLSNARWLIDAVQQRHNTLLRVVNVVLEAQREFFDHGPEHLKPLPMIQVADQLGIHVGTVSRAVADKHIQTPRGIYPLRMFFSGGTESAEGQDMAWAAVQAKLKAIIDEEDKSDPLSDDQLVEKLKEQGIEIARRTVAKYRQQMDIPPARRRKQF